MGDQISLSYSKIVVKIAAFLARRGKNLLFLTAEVLHLIFWKRSEAWIFLCGGLVVWASSFLFHGVKVFTT